LKVTGRGGTKEKKRPAGKEVVGPLKGEKSTGGGDDE